MLSESMNNSQLDALKRFIVTSGKTSYKSQQPRATAGNNFCSKSNALNILQETTRTSNISGRYYLSFGNTSEDILVDVFKNSTDKDIYYLGNDIKFPDIPDEKNVFDFGGIVDCIVSYYNKPLILEMKNSGRTSLQNKHIYQVGLYSAWLGWDAALLYTSRQVAIMGEFDTELYYYEFSPKSKIVVQSAMNIYMTNWFVRNNRLPKGNIIPKTHCSAGYCEWQRYCFKSHPKKHKLLTDAEYDDIVLEAEAYAHSFLSDENISLRRGLLKDLILSKPDDKYNNLLKVL